MFTVASKNLEYRRGKNSGYFLVCEPNNDAVESELANKLIGETPQADGIVRIVQYAASDPSDSDWLAGEYKCKGWGLVNIKNVERMIYSIHLAVI